MALLVPSPHRQENLVPTQSQTIDSIRDTFAKEGFRKEAVDVGGVTFPYYVVPAERLRQKKPDMLYPLFALRLTPPLAELRMADRPMNQKTLFGVSDKVPRRWRPHWVRHEIREFVELVVEHPERYSGTTDTIPNGCAQCSQQEWDEVLEAFQPQDCAAYAVLRAEFFGNLVQWASTRAFEDISPDSLRNFRRSHEFWLSCA
jgi:hypothetical protein